mmetsp:Transcript_3346/g.12170  ORF Transcript_3346/g.12170 Transcript_3346/m.12170 type:complete len:202 (+) Transcript_3346:2201-2806(+)
MAFQADRGRGASGTRAMDTPWFFSILGQTVPLTRISVGHTRPEIRTKTKTMEFGDGWKAHGGEGKGRRGGGERERKEGAAAVSREDDFSHRLWEDNLAAVRGAPSGCKDVLVSSPFSLSLLYPLLVPLRPPHHSLDRKVNSSWMGCWVGGLPRPAGGSWARVCVFGKGAMVTDGHDRSMKDDDNQLGTLPPPHPLQRSLGI